MLKYWVWLSLCMDNGSEHLKLLSDKYASPLEIYKTPISELKSSYLLSNSEIKRCSDKSLDVACKIISRCEQLNIEIIPYDDNRYPNLLKEISNPPTCLYVAGEMPDFNVVPTICVVGSRKAGIHGTQAAWSLSARLAAAGIVVLSGGAIGCDKNAHEGAIAVGGKTVAVLPCGINFDYLKSNAPLREKIKKHGCLISEFAPDTPLYRNAFHLRNRLLSGIAAGVVIIEAGEKSGALITARCAVEQGRDVFVVTGRAGDKSYAGSHALLRDGAKPVMDIDDVFDEYISEYGDIIDIEKAKKITLKELYHANNEVQKTTNKVTKNELDCNDDKKIKKNINETLPKNAKIVYNYIDNDLFTIDDLAGCGLPFNELMVAITQLELNGCIKALPGGRYTFTD